MVTRHLAQVNVARLAAPLDTAALADFVAGLEPINALADGATGFVWRLQTDDGDATAIRAFPDPDVIVNLTVWESVAALRDFAYRSDHASFFRRRREWFVAPDAAAVALWWIPEGTRPDVDDARRRLDFLRTNGPSPYAFTFATSDRFAPLTIARAPLDDRAAQHLIAALNAELEAQYPEPGANFFRLDADEVASGRGGFLVACLGDEPVACGAVRRITPTDAEVKRMYVAPAARGARVGAAVLAELEHIARALGATRAVLETGPRQDAAIALYERAGYHRVECWGEYANGAFSVCYAKPLCP